MKRFAALLIALCVASGCAALAETAVTRQEAITLEGIAEEITLTLYESRRGYSLWYDASVFLVTPEGQGSGMDTFRPSHANAAGVVEMTVQVLDGTDFAAAQRETEHSLQQNGYAVTAADTNGKFTAQASAGFYGEMAGQVIESYLVQGGQGIYCITLLYPTEAAEGYGARLQAMLGTFTLN